MPKNSTIIIIIALVIITVATLSIFFAFFAPSFTGQVIGTKETALVTRIVDGDTVVINDDEKVRLLGIDTPERGQILYKEASERLKGLIQNKNVFLEKGKEDKDKYGRLLRYIIIDNENINVLMVREGYASAYIFETDQYEADLYAAQIYAQENNLGIWQYKDTENTFCIGIQWFNYNAYGDDNKNLNDEYISFRNKCEETIDMTGWKLTDNSSKEYIFPSFVAAAKLTFALHTGSGANNETDLYWNQDRAVWNNGGDHMIMFNNEGKLVLEYSY